VRLVGRRTLGIVLSTHTADDGAMTYRQACAMGLEGIVSKRLSAPGGGVVKPKTMLIDKPDPSIRQAIARPLVAFNNSRASQPEDYRPLVMVLTDGDGGDILGGLWADTNFAHMHVDLLFVPKMLRGLGLGRQMLLQAEQEAVVRGCRSKFPSPERTSHALVGIGLFLPGGINGRFAQRLRKLTGDAGHARHGQAQHPRAVGLPSTELRQAICM
jgi:GNAT superfamily N-acetyltransferase